MADDVLDPRHAAPAAAEMPQWFIDKVLQQDHGLDRPLTDRDARQLWHLELAEMNRAGARSERFKRFGAAELATEPEPMQWLVRSVWPVGAYGVYGGAKKTLKSYMLMALAVAVASGYPFLGRFEVPDPRPVLLYLAEGGRQNAQRRLQSIAASMNVDLGTLPLSAVFDAAPIGSEELSAAVTRDVADLAPGLVVLDALYHFHAAGVEAQNLYERGPMLAELQRLVVGPDRALIVADHFSKSASQTRDLDLNSISQSGVAEWSHSWGLARHREAPRLREGEFRLQVQFAGRDGYGQDYDIDWSMGRLGADGLHEGPLEVLVRDQGGDLITTSADRVRAAILRLLKDEPLQHSKSNVEERVKDQEHVGGGTVRAAWNVLETEERIAWEKLRKADVNGGRARTVWRLADGESDPAQWSAGADR
ncbi:AAA family ATPase [Curtobacterium sp. MCPF17_051]|uniref:ATP-binding protein n=1 Tax=Curtobacterium sp. MCPF17_051 TaxID=2175640 RepID=UPI0015E89366|nr:AAA family ATPase [Curtobacterium sp. MCPF17_051]